MTESEADALAFLPGVAPQLGHYVYALSDPRSGEIFYVGKGRGDRVYEHALHARKVSPSETRADLKLETIREIHAAGLQVGVEIVRHRISDERTAFEIEAGLIDGLRLAGIPLSSNAVRGHGVARGWRPLEDIVASYRAKPAVINEPVMLVRVSRLYRNADTPEALYEATHKWWRISRRREPKWAFAVYEGIVRGVFLIDEWEQPPLNQRQGRLERRWAFRGRRDQAMWERYRWTDVSGYLPAGSQNPIRYLNC